jgi:hypothetical protein
MLRIWTLSIAIVLSLTAAVTIDDATVDLAQAIDLTALLKETNDKITANITLAETNKAAAKKAYD